MTTFSAPLGILAFLGMTAANCCAFMPAGPVICYGGREKPKAPPEQSSGCHAVMGCAAHRRGKAVI
jgi:hypothetical protein